MARISKNYTPKRIWSFVLLLNCSQISGVLNLTIRADSILVKGGRYIPWQDSLEEQQHFQLNVFIYKTLIHSSLVL